MKIYAVQEVCYFSSHDDLQGLFTSKEKAEAEADRLNNICLEVWEGKFPYGTPPNYIQEYDVSEYLGFVPSGETLFETYPKWKVISTVPSLGKFKLMPVGVVAVEEFELDKQRP